MLDPQERVQERIGEQIVEVPIPQISEDGEHIVDVSAPQDDVLGAVQSQSSCDFPRHSGQVLRRGLWQGRVLTTIQELKMQLEERIKLMVDVAVLECSTLEVSKGKKEEEEIKIRVSF